MAVHVFWDNSNIWISLQNLCRKKDNTPPAAVRVYLKNLDDYVIRGRKTGEKVIAGSYPPECEELLRSAQQLGYNTKFLHRIDDTNGMREQGVDMHLQLRMSLAVNKGMDNEVMAVLTGDSHVDSDSDTSFIEVIEIALKKGWTVEVYAVNGCLSEKAYQPLKEKYGPLLQIEYIDDIYEEITFVVAGDYYFPEDPSNKIHVEERIVGEKTW